jgi:protein-disulfide isomerase
VDFAFLGQESRDAAQAASCAADQGNDQFWAFHDMLYTRQDGENQGAFSQVNLKKMAADLNLDTAKFNQCLDSGKYADQVKADNQAVSQLGASSTPTFIINGIPLVGAQDYAAFTKLFESFTKQK